MSKLDEARIKIDEIDAKMAELFKQRMEAVKEIADYKNERGLPVEDKDREQGIIDANMKAVDDEKLKPLYMDFLQTTMDISKKYQHRTINGLNVVCGGEKQVDVFAAEKAFPEGKITHYERFEDAYKAVEDGKFDVAVLPLDNSYKGDVGRVYDLIFKGNLYVNSIRSMAHGGSTARYAVLSRVKNDQNLTSETESFMIMFTVKDEVGALANAISVISGYGYNMKTLRSRPMRDSAWNHYFYVELTGETSPGSDERLLAGLKEVCPMAKIAGYFCDDTEI